MMLATQTETFCVVALFCILLIAAIQQSFVARSVSSHILRLRVGICCALTSEISTLIIGWLSVQQYITISSLHFISHILYWSLSPILCFVIYKIVRSPHHYYKEKWLLWINKLWLLTTIMHILCIISCFCLCLITRQAVYEYIYSLGLYLYIIIGAVLILIISTRIFSTIRSSISKVHASALANYQEYFPDGQMTTKSPPSTASTPSEDIIVDKEPVYKLNVMQNGDPQNSDRQNSDRQKNQKSHSNNAHIQDPKLTLAQLSRAQCIVTMTIIGCWFVILFAVFILCWTVLHIVSDFNTNSNRSRYGQLESNYIPFLYLDHFLFHYISSALLYMMPLLSHWIPLDGAPLKYTKCCHFLDLNHIINTMHHRASGSTRVRGSSHESVIPKSYRITNTKSTKGRISVSLKSMGKSARSIKKIRTRHGTHGIHGMNGVQGPKRSQSQNQIDMVHHVRSRTVPKRQLSAPMKPSNSTNANISKAPIERNVSPKSTPLTPHTPISHPDDTPYTLRELNVDEPMEFTSADLATVGSTNIAMHKTTSTIASTFVSTASSFNTESPITTMRTRSLPTAFELGALYRRGTCDSYVYDRKESIPSAPGE